MHMLQVGVNLLDVNSKKILYYAQIYSHLSYGLPLWGNMISATKMESLQRLQNKCIRKIDTFEKHVQKIYKKHKILRIKDVLILENCKMAYRLEHELLPENWLRLFNTNQKGNSLRKTHSYNTRNKKLPNLAKAHCKMYNTSYLCSSLRDYQNLNTEIRKANNFQSFNLLLKNKLMTC